MTAGKGFLGIEEFLAARCPCCGEAEVSTWHARLCHRSGAQVNQHQPLVHTLSRILKSMPIRHQGDSGAPFHADRDLRMDIVIEAGWTKRCYGIGVPRQVDTPRCHVCGPASRGSHASRKRGSKRISGFHFRGAQAHDYARPGGVSFDERSYKLATLAAEIFGRFGKESSDLIDQVAASIVGGTDALSLARKGVCKERLFQIIYVTTQVAILRRVHRYRLSLRDRQAARGRQEESGGLRPLAWDGNVDED